MYSSYRGEMRGKRRGLVRLRLNGVAVEEEWWLTSPECKMREGGRKRSDMASQRGRTAPFDFPSPRLPHWRRSDMRAK